MYSKVGSIFAAALLCTQAAYAQTVVNSGLFIQNYNYTYQSENGFSLSMGVNGYSNDEERNLSLSVRSGSFLFALESLSDDQDKNFNISGGASGLSGGSRSQTGDMHRAVMGVMLPGNIAFYGFQGIAEHETQQSLSFYDSSTVSYYNKCGIKKTATHTTSGFSQDNLIDLQHTFGAGLETSMFGGVLRFEYAATKVNGTEQTISLNHNTSDSALQASGPETLSYNWGDSMNQSVQMRWKAEF